MGRKADVIIAAYEGWREWGHQFGWTLYKVDSGVASFLDGSHKFDVSRIIRDAVDERLEKAEEHHAAELAVAGAKIAELRNKITNLVADLADME